MGCDIHCFVERKDSDGRWWKVKKDLRSDYYKEGDDYFGQDRFKWTDEVWEGRNYTLFGYLANVRNGFGFAGCDTGDAIKPISMPKGLPEDASLSIREEFDEWGCDAHSCSFFTLKELKEAKQKAEDMSNVNRGYVNVENYKKFANGEKLKDWCGDISGSQIVKIPNSTMDKYIKEGFPENDKRYYTQIEWSEGLIDSVRDFFNHVLPQLEELNNENKDIRIVFWFDN